MGLTLNSNNYRWSDLGLTLKKELKHHGSHSAFSLVNWEELHPFHSRIRKVRDQCRTLTPMPGPSSRHPILRISHPSSLSWYDLSPTSDAPLLVTCLQPKPRLPGRLQALWWINTLEKSIFRFEVLPTYKSKHTNKIRTLGDAEAEKQRKTPAEMLLDL